MASLVSEHGLGNEPSLLIWVIARDCVVGQVSAGVTVVNLSLWADYEALHAFVYRHEHGRLVRQRGRWFRPMSGPTTALWWVREHERPDPPAALARLRYLRRVGPTSRAFTVRRRFIPDGRPEPRRR